MKRENGKIRISYILKKEINQMLTKGQMKTRQHHCQNTKNDEKVSSKLGKTKFLLKSFSVAEKF